MKLAIASILTSQLLLVASPAQASDYDEFCPAGMAATPLPLVGGEGSEVEKTPQNPTLSIPLPGPLPGLPLRSNYNTDWQIPGGTIYDEFVVIVVPQETDDYDIEISLKYGDDTSERLFDEGDTELTAGEPIVVNASPRSSLHPYQVNVRVGDEAVGNPYRAVAVGCGESTAAAPATGETCVPLAVVGGDAEQSVVEKEISAPTIPGPFGLSIRNNWNTDWIVPLPQRFSRFVATVESTEAETAAYDLGLSLKYADDSADSMYNQPGSELAPGEVVTIEAQPERETTPYQVNVYVGGIDNGGADYRAAVSGCY